MHDALTLLATHAERRGKQTKVSGRSRSIAFDSRFTTTIHNDVSTSSFALTIRDNGVL